MRALPFVLLQILSNITRQVCNMSGDFYKKQKSEGKKKPEWCEEFFHEQTVILIYAQQFMINQITAPSSESFQTCTLLGETEQYH